MWEEQIAKAPLNCPSVNQRPEGVKSGNHKSVCVRVSAPHCVRPSATLFTRQGTLPVSLAMPSLPYPSRRKGSESSMSLGSRTHTRVAVLLPTCRCGVGRPWIPELLPPAPWTSSRDTSSKLRTKDKLATKAIGRMNTVDQSIRLTRQRINPAWPPRVTAAVKLANSTPTGISSTSIRHAECQPVPDTTPGTHMRSHRFRKNPRRTAIDCQAWCAHTECAHNRAQDAKSQAP